MIVQCCVCRKVRSGDRWLEASGVDLSTEEISHGYCPDCAATTWRELRTMLRKNGRPAQAAG